MKYAKHLTGAEDLMFLSRNINQSYDFEFFALGKGDKRTVPLYLIWTEMKLKNPAPYYIFILLPLQFQQFHRQLLLVSFV